MPAVIDQDVHRTSVQIRDRAGRVTSLRRATRVPVAGRRSRGRLWVCWARMVANRIMSVHDLSKKGDFRCIRRVSDAS